jgi:transportin-3
MADAFNQAVSALLQNSDPASRQRANHWLEQWQQTPEAWTVATGVLQHGSGIDAQYFAAQTLRTKVRPQPRKLT